MCLGALPQQYGSTLNTVLYPNWQEYAVSSRELEVDVFQKDMDSAYARAVQTAWQAGFDGQPMSVDFATDLLDLWCGCRTYRTANVTIGVDYTQIVPAMRELLGAEKWGEYESGWEWVNWEPTREFIAEFHIRFEQIHPLPNGNGRWGRLLNAYYYGRMGAQPRLIKDRKTYLRAMRTQDINLLARLL